jgi:serine/threonine protein kinase
MSDSPATTPHGEVIDGAYRLDATLGAGGEGAVLRATRLADGQVVALKRLHLHRRADAEARTRFEREARALNGLEHPNIIRMLDFGFDEQGPYLVTELLAGRTLDALLREGPLPPEVALELGIQIAAGLGHAHAEGVVHRDIKPENVFIEDVPGRGLCAKLLDFGLARFFDSERWADAESLTREGAVLGTPLYMPAEQSLGQRADTRSDVYAVGIVIFEMLAGAPPFDAEDRLSLVRAHAMSPLPRLAVARAALTVLPEVDAVLARTLAKSADERFQDGGQLHAALSALPRPATRLA